MDITLALGGGGMRGVAHIGVLRVLEREGFRIRAVTGTSVGAIMGVLYASGYTPDEIEHFATEMGQPWLYTLPFSEGPGLLGMHRIEHLLRTYLGNRTFNDLKIPCAVVAVDLRSNREIILLEGDLVGALLGSIAYPGLFPPKQLDQYSLIDGGTLDPVPVRAARTLVPDLPVVAVSLMSPLKQPATPLSVRPRARITLANQIAQLNIMQAFRVFTDAVDIGQHQISEFRLGQDAPEVLIRPEVEGINLLDRINAVEVASRGERATEAALPYLRRVVAWPARLRRWLGL